MFDNLILLVVKVVGGALDLGLIIYGLYFALVGAKRTLAVAENKEHAADVVIGISVALGLLIVVLTVALSLINNQTSSEFITGAYIPMYNHAATYARVALSGFHQAISAVVS